MSLTHTLKWCSALVDIEFLITQCHLQAGQLHEQAHRLTQQVPGLLAGLAVSAAGLLLLRILAEVGADALVPVPVVCPQNKASGAAWPDMLMQGDQPRHAGHVSAVAAIRGP